MVFATACLLTPQVRRFALAHHLVDEPTSRRLHQRPTPRGGGVAVVAAFYVGLGVLTWFGEVKSEVAGALAGGLLVAWVGWRDDHVGVRARTRLGLQFVGALWAVTWLDGLPALRLGLADLPLGEAGPVLAVIGIVWFINLFNFMDGVDGLAASEALAVAAVAGVLLFRGGAHGLAGVAWVFAAAAGGFLVWNWPPARIFLGDIGSSFLGYSFGVLTLASDRAGAVPIVLWVVLLGVFTFDATITLVRRAIRGERLYQPHVNHGYQRLVRSGWSHRRVVVGAVLVSAALAGATVYALARPARTPLVLAVAAALMSALYGWVERRLPMGSAATHSRRS